MRGWLLVMTVAIAVGVQAQSRRVFERWALLTEADGIPPGVVIGIASAGDDLWVATHAGVAVYDGWRWRRIPLPPQRVTVLARNPAGGVFVGTEASLLRVTTAICEPVFLGEWDGLFVQSVAAADDGSAYVAIAPKWDAPLVVVRAGAGLAHRVPTPSPTRSSLDGFVRRTESGRIWVGLRAGLHVLSEDGTFVRHIPDVTALSLAEVGSGYGVASVRDSAGRHATYEWTSTSESPRRLAREGSSAIDALAMAPDGSRGVAVYRSGDVRVRRSGAWASMGVVPRHLRFVTGAAWLERRGVAFGTDTGVAIGHFGALPWRCWRHPAPNHELNTVMSHAVGGDRMAFASEGGLVRLGRNGELVVDSSYDDVVSSVAFDPEGRLWFVGAEGRLFEGQPGDWRQVGAGSMPPVRKLIATDQALYAVPTRDSHGYFWRFAAGEPQSVALPSEMSEASVNDVAIAADGALWAATSEGVAQRVGGSWVMRREESAPGRAVAVHAVGDRVWVGFDMGRIDLYEGGARRAIATPERTRGSLLVGLAEDRDGRLWVATKSGVRVRHDRYAEWGELDAQVPMIDATGIRVVDDDLWITCGGAGVIRVDLAALEDPMPRIDGLAVTVDDDHHAWARWTVQSHWGVPVASGVATRWRLDGDTWSPWSTEREALLAGLEPGEHRIEVQAKGTTGAVSASKRVAFRVERPWYLRASVLVGASIAVVLLAVAVAAALRQRRIAARDRLERDATEQRLETVRRLAGGVAHDFNNLLMIVSGSVEFAAEDGPQRAQGLERARDGIDQARGLTQQLLAFAGRGAVERAAVDVGQVLSEMRPLIEASLPPEVALWLRIDEDPLAVIADAARLHEIVLNLVLNAAEAYGEAGGDVVVEVAVVPRDGIETVVLAVTDAGAGMPPEVHRRMFEPYYSTKDHGRGLGLAVVQGAVESLGGTVVVESVEDEGTRVEVAFPRVEKPRAIAAPAAASGMPSGSILVIDDEPEIRRIVERGLRARGHDVVTAATGQEGLDLFAPRADAYACVLIDLTMPGLDGLETLRRLRGIRPDVPAILMSGFSDVVESDHPADVFLWKPFRLAQLDEALGQAAARRRSSLP